jgi:hypothetical protein
MLNKNINEDAEAIKAQLDLPFNENDGLNLKKPDNNIQNESLDYSNQIKRKKAEIDKKSQNLKKRGNLIKPMEKVLTTFNKSQT